MKKTSKKFLSFILAIFTTLSMSITTFAAEANTNTLKQDFEIDSSKSSELAVQLCEFFAQNESGDICFNATKTELLNMGITEEDANIMLSFTSTELNEFAKQIDSSINVSVPNEQEMNKIVRQPRGFVGLKLKLGPKVRSMAAVPAGAFAGGFIGWHLKSLATKGPWGAGAAAAISASVAGIVGWGVKNHMKVVNVGKNIPGVSWSQTVSIP